MRINCLLSSGSMVPDGASCRTGRCSTCSRCSTRSTSARRRWIHNDVREALGKPQRRTLMDCNFFILNLPPPRCLRSWPTSLGRPTGRWGSTSSSTCQFSARRLSMLSTGGWFCLLGLFRQNLSLKREELQGTGLQHIISEIKNGVFFVQCMFCL